MGCKPGARRFAGTIAAGPALLITLLITLLLAPARPAAAAPSTANFSGSYGVAELLLAEQPQQVAIWCVPAATRALLSAFGVGLPSQLRLAMQERTGPAGTFLSRVPAVIARYEQRVPYAYRHVPDAYALRETVRTKVGIARAPVIVAVDSGRLPWYRGSTPAGGVHALVVFGFVFAPRFAAVLVWDPAMLPQAGEHLVPVSVLWDAMQPLGAPALT